MEVTLQTGQLKILEDFFDGLSSTDQRKIFTAGFRKAAKPLVAAAQAGAPQKTGRLMKSFGTIEMPGEIAILVGARKSGAYKGWHGHLVENGTTERFRKKKGGAPTGRVVGTHFFENAFNMVEEEMYGNIEQEWYNEIDKFIIKTNRKAKKT